MSLRAREDQGTVAMSIWLVLLGLLLGLASWVALAYLVLTRPPDAIGQTIFFALFFVAVTGTILPFVRILHRAFPILTGRYHTRGVALRQSIWIGLFAAGVAGLYAARLRDLALIAILGTIFVLIESFWQQKDR